MRLKEKTRSARVVGLSGVPFGGYFYTSPLGTTSKSRSPSPIRYHKAISRSTAFCAGSSATVTRS